MAFVILFGLPSSTFLNMFVVPAAWLLAHKTQTQGTKQDLVQVRSDEAFSVYFHIEGGVPLPSTPAR